MEKPRLRHELVKGFLKYCPECKVYHSSTSTNCPICKKVLKSFFLQYYALTLFKKIFPVLVIIFLGLYGTYGIQVNERAQYKKGLNLIINKEFKAGWKETKEALTKNPLYKYVKPLIQQAKTVVEGIKAIKSNRVSPATNKEHYVLQEIYFDRNRGNSAMINNKVVFEGDTLGNVKIIKVNRDSIDIETDGQKQNIAFGRTWN